MNKKTIKLVLFLGIVSMISGLAIGAVNDIVSPIIAENDIKAEKANLELIFPGAEFSLVDYADENGVVLAVYKAAGKGVIVKATGIGYSTSDPIIALFGFDTTGKCVDVKPLAQQETNGFGSKCFEEGNIKTLYVGKGLGDSADMIAGATLTSSAMRDMLAAAQTAFQEVQ